jgi:hypothetical protein
MEHFFNLPPEEFIQNHCFRGHFGMTFFNRFERPLDHFITILRDPVEQFCSDCHFQKNRFDQGLFEQWRLNKWTKVFEKENYFNHYVQERLQKNSLSPILRNLGLQVSKDITSKIDYHKEVKSIQQGTDRDTLFHEAKSNLSKMTTIMFLEDIEASTIRLCKDLNISPQASFPTLNKGHVSNQKHKTYKEKLNKEHSERIEEYLKYDIKLYQFAHELVYGNQQNL